MGNVELEVGLTNLEKLKVLVEQLDIQNISSKEYQTTLKDIERVIKDEKNVISRLKKSETKLEHYESICVSILSIISAARI